MVPAHTHRNAVYWLPRIPAPHFILLISMHRNVNVLASSLSTRLLHPASHSSLQIVLKQSVYVNSTQNLDGVDAVFNGAYSCLGGGASCVVQASRLERSVSFVGAQFGTTMCH